MADKVEYRITFSDNGTVDTTETNYGTIIRLIHDGVTVHGVGFPETRERLKRAFEMLDKAEEKLKVL